MTTTTSNTPATAEQLADNVFAALFEQARDYFETPDGVHSILTRSGWTLRVFDDTDEQAPNGISWWIDSPEERGVESDGWEVLPLGDLVEQAEKLARLFERRAG